MSWNRLESSFIVSLLLFCGIEVYAQEFAGAESCKSCHLKIYQQYSHSGHPYKIQSINAVAPLYPANTSPGVPHPPLNTNWHDISYVIGGFAWKARFLDSQGYILTGDNRQYNLANPLLGKAAHWVAYEGSEPSRKPYTCGECHTTGWLPSGEKGPHQDELPGIYGVWAEQGVTCEACHGASAAHVANPAEAKPTTKENCGSCHARGDPSQIDAKDGLIMHHEQYEDLLASPHKTFSCSTCHDPHRSTQYKQGGYLGDDKTCKTCHQHIAIKLAAKAHVACSTCHMPYVVKSALSTTVTFAGGSLAQGDLRTHIQRIRTDAQWKMFTDDGKFVRTDEDGKAYLTLDYACLSCHVNKDRKWAQANAKKIHGH